MGSASSVSLTLDEARRRLGPDECNRFDEGFKRILHSQQDGLSLGLFISTFVAELSPTCPRNLAPAIFRAFNASKSGILTRDELIVGLCIIRTGTVEERLELVFHAANEQQNGRLVEFELRNYLALLDDNSLLAQSSLLFVRRGYASLREWVELTQECLGGGDIDALLGWVVELDHALGGRSPLPPALPTTPVVLRSRKWSIDGTPPPSPQLGPPSRTPPASLSSLPTTPRSRSSSWAGGKHSPPPSSSALRHLDFSSEGLSALRELFTKCREQSESGAVDLAALQTAFARSESAVPPPLVKAIFERLDEDGDGVVDIRDFVGGLCCCFGGGVEEKLEFCFSLFAHAEPSSVCSVLGKEGMGLLLKSLWSVEAIHSTCALEEGGMEEWSDDDGDWPGTRLPPVLVLQRQTSSSPEVLASINDLVDRAMAAFSSDGSGGGGGGDVSSEQAKASDDDGDGGSGGGGDVDDNAGGLRHLPLPGPLGALPLDTQLKALGGIAGLLMFCILALCAKRRCSKASPPSSSSSSSLPPATEANNSNAASSVGGVSNDEGEQWDDDWDDEEGGNGAEQELTPMLGQRQETIPQQVPAQRSPSESNSRGNNALPGGLGSSRGGNTAHGGGGGLGSLRKPASKPKATSSASSALNDDYPPLVTEDANSLFADLGISAKPTFVKPIQPKSKKLAELGDQMGDSSANWGNGDDDGLDDI
eukprot:CAMPEP_0171740806 /NCGR_PEP_ID=MMETSP0991-20121206/35131_1 /TAXON_ID=483369 /ORGANISM="non described non described, Strain CCMP2098" /LENGTH=705 /DNA_ID=CAMNT_0012338851 /DNA_START=26 /DNA_END=2143 /DNA_ORIENTATION=+